MFTSKSHRYTNLSICTYFSTLNTQFSLSSLKKGKRELTQTSVLMQLKPNHTTPLITILTISFYGSPNYVLLLTKPQSIQFKLIFVYYTSALSKYQECVATFQTPKNRAPHMSIHPITFSTWTSIKNL